MAQVKILTLDNLKQVYNVIDSKIESSKVTKVSELENDANYATKTEAEGYATAAVAAVIDEAPETFDTLKEVAEYIEAHNDVVDGLNAAIGNKADKADIYTKTEVDGLIADEAVNSIVNVEMPTSYNPGWTDCKEPSNTLKITFKDGTDKVISFETVSADSSNAGLMSADDKCKLDGFGNANEYAKTADFVAYTEQEITDALTAE